MKILTYLLIAFSSLSALGAQLLLKRVISDPATKAALANGPVSFLDATLSQPLTWLAILVQGAGYITWLFVLSREKLAVSFAVSGSAFYLLTALSAWYFYSENLTVYQWLGIILISAGVVLVANASP